MRDDYRTGAGDRSPKKGNGASILIAVSLLAGFAICGDLCLLLANQQLKEEQSDIEAGCATTDTINRTLFERRLKECWAADGKVRSCASELERCERALAEPHPLGGRSLGSVPSLPVDGAGTPPATIAVRIEVLAALIFGAIIAVILSTLLFVEKGGVRKTFRWARETWPGVAKFYFPPPSAFAGCSHPRVALAWCIASRWGTLVAIIALTIWIVMAISSTDVHLDGVSGPF
jgi:hypothetical protein